MGISGRKIGNRAATMNNRAQTQLAQLQSRTNALAPQQFGRAQQGAPQPVQKPPLYNPQQVTAPQQYGAPGNTIFTQAGFQQTRTLEELQKLYGREAGMRAFDPFMEYYR